MKPIRQRILDILETRQAAGTADLARMLHVTAADIRHHLRQLEREGLIRRVGTRPSRGRGRPGDVFSLARARENLGGLASNLMRVFLGDHPDPDKLADLAALFAPEAGVHSKHITQRLLTAVQKLEAQNYAPRWEAHAGAPQVIFANCPYAEIVEAHPALCRMDAAILARLLGEPVTQLEKLVQNREGARVCRFGVGKM
jgi:predicted ArsR family transcriptional regulator